MTDDTRKDAQFPTQRRETLVEWFLKQEAAGGILLIISTVLALIWANSGWGEMYAELWHRHFGFVFADRTFQLDLHHWINDGLMAVFFLFVGLEIKRELLTGELGTVRKAALPAMAALGGMVIPALIYVLVTRGTDGASGWGIPMATDIAFAIGILTLLGKRVPLSLKIFLTALAIVDDLGAVLVIAVFYTESIATNSLLLGLALVAGLFVLNAVGFRKTWVYLAVGVGVWYFFLLSGVHATIAGVLVAMTIPHRVAKDRVKLEQELASLSGLSGNLPTLPAGLHGDAQEETRVMAFESLKSVASKAGSPLVHLEHALGPWVAFFIMPVFAISNAGVVFSVSALADSLREPTPLGIILGLVLGKQLGIVGFSWIAVRLGWAALPSGVSWRLIHGAAILGGIGFTMSLFIANLAFKTTPHNLETAKMGILVASFLAAVGGLLILASVRPKDPAIP